MQAVTHEYVAGVDEAGRGPLAGPVIAAAVILDPQQSIVGLADSKQLSPTQRAALFIQIQTRALAWAIGRAEVAEIDQFNILQATLLAMQRAVLQLQPLPNSVLVDGNQCPNLPCYCQAIIKGDSLIPAISAASILAKVSRDQEMETLDRQFPGYGLAQHKGYPTAAHLQALARLGVTAIHRRSFAPVRRLLGLQIGD